MAKDKYSGRTFPSPEVKLMNLAISASWLSRDPDQQVGVVISNAKNIAIGIGWDEPFDGVSDKEMVYDDDKDFFIRNAVFNAVKMMSDKNVTTHGMKAFITHFPDLASFKSFHSNGIKNIVYLSQSELVSAYEMQKMMEVSKTALGSIEEFKGNLSWARDKWEVFVDQNNI